MRRIILDTFLCSFHIDRSYTLNIPNNTTASVLTSLYGHSLNLYPPNVLTEIGTVDELEIGNVGELAVNKAVLAIKITK